MRFKVIVATYNCPQWIGRCLGSIAGQNDPDFDVCVIDDGTPPESGQPRIIQALCEALGWDYVLNKERIGGPLPNQITAIDRLGGDPEDVIVFIDGDDWLPHMNVFGRLREIYSDPNIWVAYGTARCEPPSKTTDAARPHPLEAWEHKRSVRGWMLEHGTHYNHIRTFRRGLFTKIRRSDFHWPDGRWLTANGDTCLIIPAIEMAGPQRTHYIPEITYVYTPDHDLSEWKTHNDVNRVNPYVLHRLPHYPIMESLS